jgi:uncharacterized damage-inducible protein DinB
MVHMSVFSNPASSSAADARAYTSALLDLLGGKNPVDVLEQTPSALRRAVDGLSERQFSEPEAPGKWSVRQVLGHLADSDLVWGYRVRMVLAHDRPPLTGYDQDLFASRLRYDETDPEQALAQFELVRKGNLRLIARASRDDLKRVGVHAERGDESVEHMMRMCAGHDLLHLRQIDRIRGAIGDRR